MFLLYRLLTKMKASVITISWSFLMVTVILHMLGAWVLLSLANEPVTEVFITWIYYYVTTVSTVGYGDYSPETLTGQLIVATYLIPGGIAMFAGIVGKLSMIINKFWRHYMQGQRSFSNLSGHTIVMGWHGDTTKKIIEYLNNDPLTGEIVLCVIKDIDNPLPGIVKFVKGESFADLDLLNRAGTYTAARVIIYDECDERTVNILLSVHNMSSRDCNIVAHCDDANTASMIKRQFPTVECTHSMVSEMLVRSATDSGISRVVDELMSVTAGATQYQMCISELPVGLTYGELFLHLRRKYGATLLGAKNIFDNEEHILNLSDSTELFAGVTIYYMSNKRIDNFTYQT